MSDNRKVRYEIRDNNTVWYDYKIDHTVEAPKLEAYFDELQAWCQQHQCGRRLSYNLFKFANENELAMFLLVWS